MESKFEIFLKKAIALHGDRYDYSKANYINAKTNITIICHKHGEFLQTPTNHMSGKGCPVCANRLKLGNDEFIKKSIEKHGNNYDYSEVNYTTAVQLAIS